MSGNTLAGSRSRLSGPRVSVGSRRFPDADLDPDVVRIPQHEQDRACGVDHRGARGGAHRVTSQAVHDELAAADISDHGALLDHLRRHERGETSYLEMSKGLADSGIERWSVDTHAMTFYDRSGLALLVEQIT
jgi:Protein of unknown function (DUF1398)